MKHTPGPGGHRAERGAAGTAESLGANRGSLQNSDSAVDICPASREHCSREHNTAVDICPEDKEHTVLKTRRHHTDTHHTCQRCIGRTTGISASFSSWSPASSELDSCQQVMIMSVS